jgi:hypothetical protein
MDSVARDVAQAEIVLGLAYQILHQLPAAPDRAAPQLMALVDALHGRPAQIDGPASYVFSHLRKRDIRTALRALAVAADIVEDVRPRFAMLGR